MPTARGWVVGAIGLALSALGPAFGAARLLQVGVALVVLPVLALAVVRGGRHDLRIARRLTPERARPGQQVTATLEIANEGRRTSPLALLQDHLPEGVDGNGRLAVGGIEAGGGRAASMQLTARRRGRYELGPLELSYFDPFGLARRSVQADSKKTLLVHPVIRELSLPRAAAESHSLAVSAFKQLSGISGEDFFTLREYVEGDDLRKIHWRSTAKRGKYMIKQEETPWHARATIVIDDRAEAHAGAGARSSFERAVEAAASLIHLYHRSGYAWRLAGALEAGLPSGRGPEHYRRCLDFLAVIAARPARAEEDPLLVRLGQLTTGAGAEEGLIVAAGTLSPAIAAALGRCRRRFKQVTVLSFPAHHYQASHAPTGSRGKAANGRSLSLLARSGVRSLVLAPDEPLAGAWSSLFARGSSEERRGWDPKGARV